MFLLLIVYNVVPGDGGRWDSFLCVARGDGWGTRGARDTHLSSTSLHPQLTYQSLLPSLSFIPSRRGRMTRYRPLVRIYTRADWLCQGSPGHSHGPQGQTENSPSTPISCIPCLEAGLRVFLQSGSVYRQRLVFSNQTDK